MSDIKEFIAKTYGVVWANKTQLENLERFAALVRADEREECAKLCWSQRKYWNAEACADAIRARGQE